MKEERSKLPVGTKVKVVRTPYTYGCDKVANKLGTIVDNSTIGDGYGVEFDTRLPNGHNCLNAGKEKHCLWIDEDDVTVITDNYYIEAARSKLISILNKPRMTKKEIATVVEEAIDFIDKKLWNK